MKRLILTLTFLAQPALADDITYLAWGSPAEGKVWTQIARAFEAQNPAVKVDVQVSDWDSYWEKLRVLMAGGSPPDVFAMSPPLYPD